MAHIYEVMQKNGEKNCQLQGNKCLDINIIIQKYIITLLYFEGVLLSVADGQITQYTYNEQNDFQFLKQSHRASNDQHGKSPLNTVSMKMQHL